MLGRSDLDSTISSNKKDIFSYYTYNYTKFTSFCSVEEVILFYYKQTWS